MYIIPLQNTPSVIYMKVRVRLLIALLFVICTISVNADSLDEFVRSAMSARKIPGLSIAVVRDGKVIRESSYGFADLESRTPADRNSVYEIGSISKQFASEAIMLLVEDGKLRLDDPILQYLPANAPNTWQAITIRDLLNHTSGLKDWTEIKEFSYRREYTAEEFIDLVKPFPLTFASKDNWLYSNTNLPLVGIIVEKASGKSYEEFVTERILKRLALPSIRFKHQEDVVPNRVSGYVLRNNVLKNGEPFRPKVIAASGGMLATATDLAKWWEAVLTGRVVSQTSLEEMLKPAKISDGRSLTHGFAFFTNTFKGNKFIFHAGSTVGGFGSMVYHFPKDKLTVAVIGNLEDGGFGAEYIAKRVFNHYIPGTFVGGLKEVKNDELRDRTLQLLKDIAAKKMRPELSTNFAAKMSDAIRTQLSDNLKQMRSFAYLGSEKIGENHFILDPAAAEFQRFKMVLATKTIYYHFRMNRDGKIGWIIFED